MPASCWPPGTVAITISLLLAAVESDCRQRARRRPRGGQPQRRAHLAGADARPDHGQLVVLRAADARLHQPGDPLLGGHPQWDSRCARPAAGRPGHPVARAHRQGRGHAHGPDRPGFRRLARPVRQPPVPGTAPRLQSRLRGLDRGLSHRELVDPGAARLRGPYRRGAPELAGTDPRGGARHGDRRTARARRRTRPHRRHRRSTERGDRTRRSTTSRCCSRR